MHLELLLHGNLDPQSKIQIKYEEYRLIKETKKTNDLCSEKGCEAGKKEKIPSQYSQLNQYRFNYKTRNMKSFHLMIPALPNPPFEI